MKDNIYLFLWCFFSLFQKKTKTRTTQKAKDIESNLPIYFFFLLFFSFFSSFHREEEEEEEYNRRKKEREREVKIGVLKYLHCVHS